MAVGDVKNGLSVAVGAGSSMSIQPAGSDEYVIHNIHHADAVELYFTDGANDIKISNDTSFGAWTGMFFHVTNSIYLKVKNVAAGAQNLGYDGIQTK